MAHIAFKENYIPSEDMYINGIQSCNDDLPETDNILQKTKFFSRIGIGRETMLSFPIERRKTMTLRYQQGSSGDQAQISVEGAGKTCEHSAKSKCNADSGDKARENGSNNKQTLAKRLVALQMKTKSHSADIMTVPKQETLIQTDEESMKKFELSSAPNNLDSSVIRRSLSEPDEDSSSDFFIKTDQQMRACYYNRLIQMRILKPTPSIKNQNIIIFDWDDTLLCTSYLMALGIKDAAPMTIVSVLRPVDDIASKLLSKSVELGQVFIITNAEHGWVQSSARNFLPNTYAVIEKANIEVISARACYEDEFPGEYERWKKEAFASLSKMFEKDIITNLICIGDSNAEINAAHFLAQQFDSAIIKTIKFKEKPRPEELTKQHCLVLDKFDKLFVSLRNSTIRLERKHI